MAATRILIGCSGWQYPHWRGDLYPAELKPKDWFAHYAGRFRAVEVNNTFYRWPTDATFARWRAAAPRGFRYVVKGSRFATHMKQLNDPAATVGRVLAGVRRLGSTLAGVLWQLPPRMRYRREKLAPFLAELPADGTHAIEFRHASFFVDEVYALLDRHRVGFVVHDHGWQGLTVPRIVLGCCCYLRLHGFAEGRYAGGYPDDQLARWADWLVANAQRGLTCAFFNNDLGGDAPRDAARLQALVEERSPRRAT